MIFNGINRVTSGFMLPDRPTHKGIDIVGDLNPAVHCALAGKVGFAGNVNDKAKGGSTWEWGNYIRIDAKDVKCYYCHLADGSIRVKPGAVVNAGDWIATMGNTGKSFGAHLHFEVRKNLVAINPAAYAGVLNVKGIYK